MRAARAYQNVDRHTSVLAAKPLDLVILAHDALLRRLKLARDSFISGDLATRGQELSNALEVIDKGLIGALDMHQGGTLAIQLRRQYQVWTVQILQCNIKSDASMLEAVIEQVETVRSGWVELRQTSSA
jgi:flagellar protein FliS